MHYLFVLLFFLTCTPQQSADDAATIEHSAETSPTINKALLLKLVNQQRAKGCKCGNKYYPPAGELVWNDVLEQVAYNHSRDMAQHNYFSHTGRNGSNTGTRMEAVGYNWQSYAENIYRTQGYSATEPEVINAWVKSPGHCVNLMGKQYKEMGLARFDNYWTQVFGSQMPK